MRALATTLLLLIGVLAASHAGAQEAPDKVAFRLDWQLTGYHVPFYWAQAKGYYKDQNLEVEIKPGAGSGQTVNLVGSGQDDLGFADYLLMATAAAKGMDVKAIFGVVQDGAWAIISHRDNPIRKPQDLVGRSVASTADHKALLDLFLALNGIPADKVTVRVTNPATRNTVFDQGQVDGMMSITIGSPMDLVVRAEEGKSKPVHFMPFADFGVAPEGQGVVANGHFLAAKPDVVRRFVRASARAFAEASRPENVDEAVAIALRLSGASPERRASVKLQWVDTIGHLHTRNSEGKPIGWMSRKDWENSLDVLRKTGRLSEAISLDRVYTDEFIPADAR